MTPTERQISDFKTRPFAEQLDIGVEILFAQCQRALRLRDENRRFREGALTERRAMEIDHIYRLKTAFLEAAALRGRCQVRSFNWRTPTDWTCGSCGRTWKGGAGTCFKCHQAATGVEHAKSRWWLYLMGDRRFLSPYASQPVQNIASECVPMNPASAAAKDTIDPPYTIEAQLQMLQLLAAKLRNG